MIGETYAPYAPNIVQKAAYAYNSPPPQGGGATEKKEDAAVIVELSEAAQKGVGLLSQLPNITLDPAVHMANAETELKALMQKYGIPEGETVNITSSGDGTFVVEGDHPLLSEVEREINEGTARELRNSLIGAHTGSVISRIGAATEMAMKGADANPSMMETYYDWVLSVANEAKGMSFSYSLQNGELSGSLVTKQGTAIAHNEGLELPVA
ncbi:MAG: hypothetical protein MI743_05250 [Sneathiellales bacterium]|nr:hypothetical protein [Sneathiellales bacterium]